jgi:glutamate synthase (NADPH/NADH) small chain
MTKKITQPARTPMPTLDPDVRRHTFDEVATGYTLALAQQEAARCVECRNQPCVAGCPVGTDIPRFVQQLARGDIQGAYGTITSRNLLPSICGRVCPQETQCESRCTLGIRFEPVSIGRLERFVGDSAAAPDNDPVIAKPRPTGHRVAIVGSGPAGLTAAAELARLGHAVTIFEALHEAGGVLVYGIPEFRLPKGVVAREIQRLGRLGVDLRLDQVIGQTYTLDELLGEFGYEAIFVGTGAGLPHFPDIPGVNLIGVYSANEYLTRSNLMRADRFPETDTPPVRGRSVAVVGGGNTAVDAVRTAVRLGAERALLVYRRSRHEMPARREEVQHAEEEGVEIVFLTAPLSIRGDGRQRVHAMTCTRMTLGDADVSGRRRAAPEPGSEFDLSVDTVVFAIGQGANVLLQSATRDLRTTSHGYIVADAITGSTTKPKVFAGGDIVTGSATVISAMGAGRRAAAAIHALISGGMEAV